ncbi:hypothetical protein BDV93DRAFT_64135 [Ceratobasidium sp. AG-I]|nr:hypothetical protein BDV93DRAFT_64135 [Ceratobasidium sp. AG-I]
MQQGSQVFQGQQGGFQTQGAFQGQAGGYQGQQGSFQLSQPFSPQQPFQNNPSPPSSFSPQGPLSPQQGTFVQQSQFTPSIHPPPSSLYEPSSVGLSRAYTTVGAGFQPFSPDPAPGGMGYGRMGPADRVAAGSVPMGQSSSAQAHFSTQQSQGHLSAQPYSSRQSLAFEPESFGLGGRERQLTAPSHPGHGSNMKALNLGLAGMNLSQRREFGLDGGPLSAPMRPNGTNMNNMNNNGNNGGMKPSALDNNVYMH